MGEGLVKDWLVVEKNNCNYNQCDHSIAATDEILIMSRQQVRLVKVISLDQNNYRISENSLTGSQPETSTNQANRAVNKAKGKRTPTKQEILARLSLYNKYHEKGSPHYKLTYIQDANGILISGNLRVHWGLKRPIKQALSSIQSLYGSSSQSPLPTRKLAKNQVSDAVSRPISLMDEDLESTFTPQFDSAAAVNATSRTTTPFVIKNLFHKFRIINNPKEFALFIKRPKTGDCRRLSDVECPLLARLMLGPNEETFRIFVCEVNDPKPAVNPQQQAIVLSPEAAQYINFSLTELSNIIEMYKIEEEKEKLKIKEKYSKQRELLQDYLANASTTL
ncbi:Ras association domain-containing protein 6 [Trichoplax sp. H2]|nr:Ras association domain-containing protein 6 [Trichoplax sp. H2]|eukprot:RDD41701.1 Ras association domain-containing protein 6 [Trichoplax sp. H2]